MSGVAQTRTGMPSPRPSMHSKSPTASATRYVDIFGVVSNVIGVMAGGSRRVGDNGAVGDGVIAVVDDRGEREGGLERRLVERRKHPPRVGRFELRDGVAALVRLAQVEPAQIAVEDAVVG